MRPVLLSTLLFMPSDPETCWSSICTKREHEELKMFLLQVDKSDKDQVTCHLHVQ